ncbi:hypothetical protein HDU81_006941, partial [Chytriomyces hyalinus]
MDYMAAILKSNASTEGKEIILRRMFEHRVLDPSIAELLKSIFEGGLEHGIGFIALLFGELPKQDTEMLTRLETHEALNPIEPLKVERLNSIEPLNVEPLKNEPLNAEPLNTVPLNADPLKTAALKTVPLNGCEPLSEVKKKSTRTMYLREEDAAIIAGFRKYGFNWTKIALENESILLGRNGTAIKDRVIYLKKYAKALSEEELFRDVKWKGGVIDNRDMHELERNYEKAKMCREPSVRSVGGPSVEKKRKSPEGEESVEAEEKRKTLSNGLKVECDCGELHNDRKLLLEGIQ